MKTVFDTHGTETEVLLNDGRPLEDALRYARARIEVDVEEEAAVLSKRMTVPVFQGEPWR